MLKRKQLFMSTRYLKLHMHAGLKIYSKSKFPSTTDVIERLPRTTRRIKGSAKRGE